MKKMIFWTPKNGKIHFFQNLNSQFWWTIGGGQDNATGHLDTVKSFGSISILKVSVLATVEPKH